MIISRDVTFNEAAMLKPNNATPTEISSSSHKNAERVKFDVVTQAPDDTISVQPASEITKSGAEIEENAVGPSSADASETGLGNEAEMERNIQESIATSRPKRDIKKPSWFRDCVTYALSVNDEGVPETYTQAIHSVEFEEWKEAMSEKMASLHKNDTWVLTKLPKDKKAIGCK